MMKRIVLAAGCCIAAAAIAGACAVRYELAKDAARSARMACDAMSLNHPLTCEPSRLIGYAGSWAETPAQPFYPEEHAVVRTATAERDALPFGWYSFAAFLIFIGLTPLVASLAWRFTLDRIADLSDAVRGARH